jgi:hypothetical protein
VLPAEPDMQATAPGKKEAVAGACPGEPEVQQLWRSALYHVWPTPVKYSKE